MPDDREKTSEESPSSSSKKPANVAPDAVKDPNEKTEGKPGMGGGSGKPSDGETDPGSS